MAAATRKGDYSTGHDLCAPTTLTGGSPNVRINGLEAGRKGDSYGSHSCISHDPHADTITGGSSTVFINGSPAARVGDVVSPGGSVQGGSANVFIGG